MAPNVDIVMKSHDFVGINHYLRDYPNKTRFNWFMDVCAYGVDIQSKVPYPSRISNSNPSFSDTEKLSIGTQILKWRLNNFLIGPIPFTKARELQIVTNQFFAVPKTDGTSRGILNLSDSRNFGFSINDCLDPHWCTVEYLQQLEIIELLHILGPGAYIWAKDILDGYYNINIRKHFVHKLGFYFDNKIYLFQVLPMGLASSPRIFTEFMHFPIWAFKHDKPHIYYKYVDVCDVNRLNFRSDSDITYDSERMQYKIALVDSYVDDILGGHSCEDTAWEQWDHSEKVLNVFSLPTKADKGRPPNQRNIWLGKHYDTVRQWVKLSQKKFNKYSNFIDLILGLNYVSVRTLAKIVGKARHMGTIYRPLFAFARGLEVYFNPNYLNPKKSQIIDYDRFLHVSPALKADLLTLKCAMFKAHKFGVPFEYFRKDRMSFDFIIHTDASLKTGIGATFSNGFFLQEHWEDINLYNNNRDIVWRELAAIYTSLMCISQTLGNDIMDKSIHLFTDSEACKYMLISMRSKLYRPDLQILINKICLLLLDTRINFRIDHIPGKQNIYADNLSRYTLNPLGSQSHIFHTRIDALQSLQSASDLTQYFKIDPRRLKWIDDDESNQF